MLTLQLALIADPLLTERRALLTISCASVTMAFRCFATKSLNSGPAVGNALALQSDGKILLTGAISQASRLLLKCQGLGSL